MLTLFGERESNIVTPRKSRAATKFSGVRDLMHVQKFVVGTWEILRMIIVYTNSGRVKKSE